MTRIMISRFLNIYIYIYNKQKCIFIDPGHLANCVYKEYVRQFFGLLGKSYKLISDEPSYNELIMPVYGCVKRYLGLEWVNYEDTIKNSTFTMTGYGITLDEYVKEYIFFNCTQK